MITAKTIDHLFDKMLAVYGAAWDRHMGSAQIADVKTVWGHELSRFTREDIVWALDNLPENCPNVIKFKNLCREAPRAEVLQLAPPAKANAEVIAASIAKQTGLAQAMTASRIDPKAWAPRIIRRLENGECISPTVVKMARECIAQGAN